MCSSLDRICRRAQASRAQAVQFRRAELPFVVTDLPELVRCRRLRSTDAPVAWWLVVSVAHVSLPPQVATSARWTRAYLEQHLTGKYPVDVRQDNRFMHHAGAQLSVCTLAHVCPPPYRQPPIADCVVEYAVQVSDRAHVSFADWAAATEEHFHWHVPGQRAADCNFSAPIGAKSYVLAARRRREAGGHAASVFLAPQVLVHAC